MQKKYIIILLLIIIVIISLILIISNKNSRIDKDSIAYEFYSQYKDNVDAGASSFMESEAFKKMNEDNQIKEMNNLLKIYKKIK